MIFRKGNLGDWAFEAYKSGYWFTFVSVELFFTVVPILLLFSKFKVPMWRRSAYLLLLCATIMFIFLTIMNRIGQNDFLDLMSIELYYSYILFFVLGMIAKIHLEQFNRFCSNLVCVRMHNYIWHVDYISSMQYFIRLDKFDYRHNNRI